MSFTLKLKAYFTKLLFGICRDFKSYYSHQTSGQLQEDGIKVSSLMSLDLYPSHKSARRQHKHCCDFQNSAESYLQAPTQGLQPQCAHGQQEYKDLYGNADKRLKKIIILTHSQLKSLTLLRLGSFLPVWLFPRSDPI